MDEAKAKIFFQKENFTSKRSIFSLEVKTKTKKEASGGQVKHWVLNKLKQILEGCFKSLIMASWVVKHRFPNAIWQWKPLLFRL